MRSFSPGSCQEEFIIQRRTSENAGCLPFQCTGTRRILYQSQDTGSVKDDEILEQGMEKFEFRSLKVFTLRVFGLDLAKEIDHILTHSLTDRYEAQQIPFSHLSYDPFLHQKSVHFEHRQR